MTNIEDIMLYVRENLSRVLGLGMLLLITIGMSIFAATRVLPAVQDHNLLASQLADARAVLAQQAQAQQGAPSAIQGQLDKMQGKLSDQAGIFLTEAEVGIVLNSLYGYADASGVQIVQMEAQLAPLAETPEAVVIVYNVQVFQLAVSGDVPQLIGFVTHIREAAIPGVSIENLKIEPDDEGKIAETDILTMDLLLYTSPFATGQALAEVPTPAQPGISLLTPTATVDGASSALVDASSSPGVVSTPADSSLASSAPTALTQTPAPAVDVEGLVREIDRAWAEQDWPGVISLASQVLAVTPDYEGVKIKLYTAHLNYGYLLISQEKYPEAEEAFDQALDIMPNSSAALAGLEMLMKQEESGDVVYVVRWGDTLTNIARRFNTTIQAIKATNGLADDRIYANQELHIPQ